MEDVADALEEAKEEIFITDWWWVSVCHVYTHTDTCDLKDFGWSVSSAKCENTSVHCIKALTSYSLKTSVASTFFSRHDRINKKYKRQKNQGPESQK